MITFVMPTLWKSKMTPVLIKQFERCTFEFELIIIDNANSGYTNQNTNIKIISFEKNIGVNPAWNIGVKEAKYNYVCLINDDIVINIQNYIYNVREFINNHGDFHLIAPYNVGGFSGFFSTEINKDTDIWWDKPEIMTHMKFGMGCLMLFPKEVWIEIPDGLIIYNGDSILWYHIHNIMNSNKIWWFGKNVKIIGEFHTSTSTNENDRSMLQEEELVFQNFIKSGEINKLSKWQK